MQKLRYVLLEKLQYITVKNSTRFLLQQGYVYFLDKTSKNDSFS